LVGQSEQFLELLKMLERVARHGCAPVLLRGETGTGKELVARAIHYLGPRHEYPFVPINCGALPESLAENELFGHRTGAFTDAARESIGLVRLAHNGTLFLDEVDSLPARAQVALLRFLQDGSFRPLGSSREERANVRIIAASNSDLEEQVRVGRFRMDLYYRLNVLFLTIPPLRDRHGDVRLLAQHFMRQCANQYKLPARSLHEATADWFDRYAWPGNVRELENLVQREYLLSDGDQLHITAPTALATAPAAAVAVGPDASHMTYRAARTRLLEEFNRNYLCDLLHKTGGNVTQAAQLAGKERRALGKLLKRYRLGRVAAHPNPGSTPGSD
jgi:DNA-binding NtrC family response regulator